MEIKVVQHLDQLIEKSGFKTIEELLDKSIIMGDKVSRSSIQKILSNTNLDTLSLSTIIKLCKVLNCSPYDLITFEISE